MEDIVEKAFEALKTLPREDRERIAWELIERIEDKTEWDQIIASPKALLWLEDSSQKALSEYKKIRKNLSHKFVSMGLDNLLREGTYWDRFDDLPDDVRKLAEANFQSWKKNPEHPGLRFKKIHPEMPIYSFRVGKKYRTVGVEADDSKIAWFWVGSFDTFRAEISA